MAQKRDFYEVLGLSREASQRDIRAAYRRLGRQLHPDVCDDPNAAERFKAVSEAYAVLSDEEKRRQYDMHGHNGPQAVDFTADIPDIFEIFRSVIGGDFGRGGFVERRGEDLRYDLALSLEEVAAGLEREVALARLVPCETCNQSGAAPGTSREPCRTCAGHGRVRYAHRALFMSFTEETVCPDCGGLGTVVQTPCPDCGGEGRVRKTSKLKVSVPAGIEDGQRIRYRGEGNAGPFGSPPGSLDVIISVRPHDTFVRQGTDIISEVRITFPQAALGDTITVPGLRGPLELTVPPGIQSGETLRLPGEGLPSLRSNRRGDQHVVVRVTTPETLTSKQRELLLEFSREDGLDVKPVEKRTVAGRLREAFGR